MDRAAVQKSAGRLTMDDVKVTKLVRDGRTGGFVEAEPMPDLQIGHQIIAFGYAMEQIHYAVSGPRGEYGYPLVRMSSWHEGSYFGVEHRAYNDTRPLRMKFGIGFYYDDSENPMVYPEHRIKAALRRARLVNAYLAKKKADKNAEYLLMEKNLPLENPHLTVMPGVWDYMVFRKNLIADLKKHFPGTKFSVKKRWHSSVTIEWTDGAAEDSVYTYLGKWSDHKTDDTGDYRDPAPTVWTNLFGGINYLSTGRRLSPEAEALRSQIPEEYGDLFHRIIRKTDIPEGAYDLRMERTEVTCGMREEFYRVAYSLPQKEVQNEKAEPAAAEAATGLTIVEYSDKAIAVIGDTRTAAVKLKELGGAFNRKLKCGPGWIFPKKAEASVREGLGL